MKENKFLKLIKTLDKQELKAFHKYLYGLYGKQEKMLRLFNYFYDFLKKDKEIKLLNEDVIQNQLFHKKQASKVLANLFADLYKYLAEFLRWQKINADADNYIKDKLQIEIFKERKLDDWFYAKIEKTKKGIDNAPMDMWSFLKLFELNHTSYFKFSTEKHNIETFTLLSQGLSYLDIFFIAAKLNYACEIENKALINQSISIDNWLMDLILTEYTEKIEANDYLSSYRLTLELLKTSSRIDYQYLKNEFILNRNAYNTKDQLFFLTILLNFNVQKIRGGNLDYNKEVFELYKIGIEEKISILDNEIGAVPFFNILNVACSLEKIDWAENFLENYTTYLNAKDKKEIIKLANSIIFFEKKEFDQVLIQLRDIIFKNVFYGTRARALILKSLVEENTNKSLIQAECDAFSQFLRRDGILAENTLEAFSNFVRLVKMMYVNSKTTKVQLKDFMENQKLLVYRIWLQKKVENFKGPS